MRSFAAAPVIILAAVSGCDDSTLDDGEVSHAAGEPRGAEKYLGEGLAARSPSLHADGPDTTAPPLQLEGEARYGSTSLAPGFSPDPRELRGTTDGAYAAAELGEHCDGFITAEPLHAIEAEGPFARLHLITVSEGPTAIVLSKPDGGVLCTPLAIGSNSSSELATHLTPGTHRLWLATERPNDAVRYVVGLSEIAMVAEALSSP